jgi:triacylglycerol lipase
MSLTVAYSASKGDLLSPYKDAGFFSAGLPKTEGALCAEMARLAYCRGSSGFEFDQERIANILSRVEFTKCQFFESVEHFHAGGTHCFLAVREGGEKPLAVLSFRGTDAGDATDIATDADTIRTPWEAGGTVHEGFAKALNDVRPSLDQALKSIDLRILFTGHSLGAALATLEASVRNPDALYTFGSPRIGDEQFVNSLKDVNGRRYVDCCDIVTRIPPEALGFVHVGNPYYIKSDRSIAFNPAADLIKADQDQAREHYLINYAWKIGNVAVRDLADHAPINYVTAVAANDPP